MAKFTENPANFSQPEWAAIQDMKKQVDQFQKLVMKTVVSQQEGSSAFDRPAKGTSAKKNWIPL